MAISNFSEYLEDLCKRHVDVKHSPTAKHFVDSEAEKDTSEDTTLCYPAVILSKGSFAYSGSPDAYTKGYSYNLFVLEHITDTGDYEQIRTKRAFCSMILDELLQKIMEDKRARKHPFLTMFSLSGIEGDDVENIDNALYGVMVELSIDIPFPVKICREAFESEPEL